MAGRINLKITHRLLQQNRPQGDIGLAYSITSSAVAGSEGEIVTLFHKRVSLTVPRDGWWVSDVWGALDGRIPPVYGWYRPRIPWIKSGDFERVLLDCGVKGSVSYEVIS